MSTIVDALWNARLSAEPLFRFRKSERRHRRLVAPSHFALPTRVDALLGSPWFGAYLEQLIVDITAPYANMFSRKAIESIRLDMLDKVTVDPVLRGLIAQIGTAFETSHSGAVRVLCLSGAKRVATVGAPLGTVEETPGMRRLSEKRTLKIY
jgi:hypothetical protein